MTTPERTRESCARCGDQVGPGSPLYIDRVRSGDQWFCLECWRAEHGHVIPLYPEPEVPIDMPSTNLPQTH